MKSFINAWMTSAILIAASLKAMIATVVLSRLKNSIIQTIYRNQETKEFK